MSGEDSVPIVQMAREYHSLKAVLERFDGEEETNPQWDAITAPLRERMTELTTSITEANARTTADLTSKATVLLDWIDPEGIDARGLLTVSLCRDVMLMFPLTV